MKKVLLLLFAPFFALLIASPVLAVDVVNPICEEAGAEKPTICEGNQTGTGEDTDPNPIVGPDGVLTTTVSILSIALGVIAVIVIIISGIRMTVSQGNPQTVNSARNQLIYALVGLMVAAIAQFAVIFIIRRL